MSAERFWGSAARDGDCLVWQKSKRINGYGQVNWEGKNRSVHRVAYELAVGPIPAGMLVDHSCRNRACVEPTHLRLATVKQNAENRDIESAGISGVRGVRWDKSRAAWTAALTHNYKTVNLGRFPTIEEAAAAVSAARSDYFTHSIERSAS